MIVLVKVTTTPGPSTIIYATRVPSMARLSVKGIIYPPGPNEDAIQAVFGSSSKPALGRIPQLEGCATILDVAEELVAALLEILLLESVLEATAELVLEDTISLEEALLVTEIVVVFDDVLPLDFVYNFNDFVLAGFLEVLI